MRDRLRLTPTRGLQLDAKSALPAQSASPRVDRDAGIIRGASAMQAVEALGHKKMIDGKTLSQVRDLGNASVGIKSRFTHPGLCADGMGSMLGRMHDFRVVGDKVVGDLHLAASAAKSPDGDLRAYVLDLAEEDPGAFGMSVVISGHDVWVLADGSEISTRDPSLRRGHGEDSWFARPDNATTEIPILRVDELHAVDVVDEPAANRDGLFGVVQHAMSRGTNAPAAQAFAELDRLRDALGLSLADARAFLDRYFAARHAPAAATHNEPAGGATATKDVPMDAKKLAELCKANKTHTDLILSLNAEGKSEAEILAAIKDADHAALAARVEAQAKQIADDAAKHAAELSAEKAERVKLQAALDKAQKDLAAFSELKPKHKDPGDETSAAPGPKRQIPTSKSAELSAADVDDLRAGRAVMADG